MFIIVPPYSYPRAINVHHIESIVPVRNDDTKTLIFLAPATGEQDAITVNLPFADVMKLVEGALS